MVQGAAATVIIGIDFDETFTADPVLWAKLIADAQLRGHQCLIVTCRMRTSKNQSAVNAAIIDAGVTVAVPVVFTGLEPKHPAAIAAGYAVDVWIDDDPDSVTYGKPVDRLTSRKRARDIYTRTTRRPSYGPARRPRGGGGAKRYFGG